MIHVVCQEYTNRRGKKGVAHRIFATEAKAQRYAEFAGGTVRKHTGHWA